VRRALAFTLFATLAAAGAAGAQGPFSHADTLRGSLGPARSWWDVTYYDLHVRIDPADSAISGWNAITYRVLAEGSELQVDLQAPLVVDSAVQGGRRLGFRREGNAYFVTGMAPARAGELRTLTVYYHGRPVVAANPPWDGGFVWTQDRAGRAWVATANQGLGASVWWPNKDHQTEEPDSQRISLTVPDPMMNVSNGRLRRTTPHPDGTTTYEWFVASPINNYAIAVNAGTYAHWQETLQGEAGALTLDFWPLAENEAQARRQWAQTAPVLRCFERWFGPYPWYEDGYKLVEAPHLGMEHQSAVAYGNGYRNGYRGTDLSGSGRGLDWDFIIVHETAHEWWGNNLTTADVADMWVHEGFGAYAENLYVECLTGSKEAGADYVIGTRSRILNDRPIIGAYGVQDSGSDDMYYKGANLLHTIRQLVDDDARWREILRGLNRDFGRQIVTSAQVEAYVARAAGLDLSRVFDQYLRTSRIPVLEWRRAGGGLENRWANVVDGFAMPVRIRAQGRAPRWITPTTAWQSLQVPDGGGVPEVDRNFYVDVRAP